jgi:hypothetical protein
LINLTIRLGIEKINFEGGFFIKVVDIDVTFEMKLTLLNLELCNSKYDPETE